MKGCETYMANKLTYRYNAYYSSDCKVKLSDDSFSNGFSYSLTPYNISSNSDDYATIRDFDDNELLVYNNTSYLFNSDVDLILYHKNDDTNIDNTFWFPSSNIMSKYINNFKDYNLSKYVIANGSYESHSFLSYIEDTLNNLKFIKFNEDENYIGLRLYYDGEYEEFLENIRKIYDFKLRLNGLNSSIYTIRFPDIKLSKNNTIVEFVINKTLDTTNMDYSDIELKIINKINYNIIYKVPEDNNQYMNPFISVDRMTNTSEDITINCRYDVSIIGEFQSKNVIKDLVSEKSLELKGLTFSKNTITIPNNSFDVLEIRNNSDEDYFISLVDIKQTFKYFYTDFYEIQDDSLSVFVLSDKVQDNEGINLETCVIRSNKSIYIKFIDNKKIRENTVVEKIKFKIFKGSLLKDKLHMDGIFYTAYLNVKSLANNKINYKEEDPYIIENYLDINTLGETLSFLFINRLIYEFSDDNFIATYIDNITKLNDNTIYSCYGLIINSIKIFNNENNKFYTINNSEINNFINENNEIFVDGVNDNNSSKLILIPQTINVDGFNKKEGFHYIDSFNLLVNKIIEVFSTDDLNSKILLDVIPVKLKWKGKGNNLDFFNVTDFKYNNVIDNIDLISNTLLKNNNVIINQNNIEETINIHYNIDESDNEIKSKSEVIENEFQLDELLVQPLPEVINLTLYAYVSELSNNKSYYDLDTDKFVFGINRSIENVNISLLNDINDFKNKIIIPEFNEKNLTLKLKINSLNSDFSGKDTFKLTFRVIYDKIEDNLKNTYTGEFTITVNVKEFISKLDDSENKLVETVYNILSDDIEDKSVSFINYTDKTKINSNYEMYFNGEKKANNKYIIDSNNNKYFYYSSLADFMCKDMMFLESGYEFSYKKVMNNFRDKETNKLDSNKLCIIAKTLYKTGDSRYFVYYIENYDDLGETINSLKSKLNRLNGSKYHYLIIENKNDNYDYKIIVNDIEYNENDIISNDSIEIKTYKFKLLAKPKDSLESNWYIIDQFVGCIDNTKPLVPKFQNIVQYQRFNNKDTLINALFNLDILNEFSLYNKQDMNLNFENEFEETENKELLSDDEKNYYLLSILSHDVQENGLTITNKYLNKYINLNFSESRRDYVIITNNNDFDITLEVIPSENFSNINIQSNLTDNFIENIDEYINNKAKKFKLARKSSITLYFNGSMKDIDVNSYIKLRFQNMNKLWFEAYCKVNENGLNEETIEKILKDLLPYRFYSKDNNNSYNTEEYFYNDNIHNIFDLTHFNKSYLYKTEIYLDKDILIYDSNKSNELLFTKDQLKLYLYNGVHDITLYTYKFNGEMNYYNYHIVIAESNNDIININNERNVIIPRNEFNEDINYENEIMMDSFANLSITQRDKNSNLYLYKITEYISKMNNFTEYIMENEMSLYERLHQSYNIYRNFVNEHYGNLVDLVNTISIDNEGSLIQSLNLEIEDNLSEIDRIVSKIKVSIDKYKELNENIDEDSINNLNVRDNNIPYWNDYVSFISNPIIVPITPTLPNKSTINFTDNFKIPYIIYSNTEVDNLPNYNNYICIAKIDKPFNGNPIFYFELVDKTASMNNKIIELTPKNYENTKNIFILEDFYKTINDESLSNFADRYEFYFNISLDIDKTYYFSTKIKVERLDTIIQNADLNEIVQKNILFESNFYNKFYLNISESNDQVPIILNDNFNNKIDNKFIVDNTSSMFLKLRFIFEDDNALSNFNSLIEPLYLSDTYIKYNQLLNGTEDNIKDCLFITIPPKSVGGFIIKNYSSTNNLFSTIGNIHMTYEWSTSYLEIGKNDYVVCPTEDSDYFYFSKIFHTVGFTLSSIIRDNSTLNEKTLKITNIKTRQKQKIVIYNDYNGFAVGEFYFNYKDNEIQDAFPYLIYDHLNNNITDIDYVMKFRNFVIPPKGYIVINGTNINNYFSFSFNMNINLIIEDENVDIKKLIKDNEDLLFDTKLYKNEYKGYADFNRNKDDGNTDFTVSKSTVIYSNITQTNEGLTGSTKLVNYEESFSHPSEMALRRLPPNKNSGIVYNVTIEFDEYNLNLLSNKFDNITNGNTIISIQDSYKDLQRLFKDYRNNVTINSEVYKEINAGIYDVLNKNCYNYNDNLKYINKDSFELLKNTKTINNPSFYIDKIKSELNNTNETKEKMSLYKGNLDKMKLILDKKADVSEYREFISKNTDNLSELLYRINELLTDAYANSDKGVESLDVSSQSTEKYDPEWFVGYYLPHSKDYFKNDSELYNSNIRTYNLIGLDKNLINLDKCYYLKFDKNVGINSQPYKDYKNEVRNYNIESFNFINDNLIKNIKNIKENYEELYKSLEKY